MLSAHHASFTSVLVFLYLVLPSQLLLGELLLVGLRGPVSLCSGPYLLQFDIHHGCERLIELLKELEDLDMQAAQLEQELAGFSAKIFSSKSSESSYTSASEVERNDDF